jgi:hypothetical protein
MNFLSNFLSIASLSRIACSIQPVHQWVLVWTRQPDFQDADPHQCWSHQGVPVCAYRDLVRLLPGAGKKVVAQRCPDWNQAHVPAITRACGVCCSTLPHPGHLKLPLIPAGDHSTIPRSMHCRKNTCYPLGVCDRQGEPGSGSPLFYINTWAMVWHNDYPALATWNVHGNKTDPVWTCLGWAAAVSLHAKPTAVANTALIQRILTERCHILTDRQYMVQCLLFSAHSAHIAQYLQVHAHTCRYLQIFCVGIHIPTDLSVGMM